MSTTRCDLETAHQITTCCAPMTSLHKRIANELGPEAYARCAKGLDAIRPCDQCEIAARQARSLAGVRLGRLERRILLGLSDELFTNVWPEGPSRAEDEAMRRALRKLDRVGLADKSRHYILGKGNNTPQWWIDEFEAQRRRQWAEPRRWHARMSARLTPLGALVVSRFAAELQDGKPIRWGPHLDELARAVHKDFPERISIYASRIEEARQQMALHSALAVSYKNPDAVKNYQWQAETLAQILAMLKKADEEDAP